MSGQYTFFKFIQKVEHAILSLSFMHCPGCKITSPSQEGHSCLTMNFEEKLESYFEEAYDMAECYFMQHFIQTNSLPPSKETVRNILEKKKNSRWTLLITMDSEKTSIHGDTLVPIGKRNIFVTCAPFNDEPLIQLRYYFHRKKKDCNGSSSDENDDTYIPTKRGIALKEAEFEDFIEKMDLVKKMIDKCRRVSGGGGGGGGKKKKEKKSPPSPTKTSSKKKKGSRKTRFDVDDEVESD